MRDRFPLAMLAGVLFLAVLGVWISRGAARGGFADVLSTRRSEPNGARALYLWAEGRGLGPARLRQSLEVIAPGTQLVLLAVDLAEDGRGHLLDGAGDQELPAQKPPEDDDARDRGTNALRAPRLTESEREQVLAHVRDGATLVYVPWGAPDNPLLQALGVRLTATEKGLGLRTLVPAQPTPWTRGVERVVANVQATLALPAGHTPLLVDEALEAVVAARVPWGQGEVLVIAAPELAMNKALARADNAVFWASLLSTVAQKGRLGFDEFHHGFTGERSLGEFAARYGLQFALLQLLLGVGLWALALRRFGRPRAPQEEARLGATDALSATSRIYREGRHHLHAAQAIVRELAWELSLLAGAGTRAEPHDVALALRARGRADLAAGLELAAAHAARTSREADLHDVAARAAALRQQLRTRKARPPSTQPRSTP